jgi:hypothetical protein
MIQSRTTPLRIACGVLLSTVLFGCEQVTQLPTQVDPAVQGRASSGPWSFDRSKESPVAGLPAPKVLRSPSPMVSVVVNGSFEENGGHGTPVLPGWTIWTQPGLDVGSWFAQTGDGSPRNGIPVQPPPHGNWAAMTDQNGPSTHILYQDVAIPAGGAELRFDRFFFNQGGEFVTPPTLNFIGPPNQQFRVDIMDPAAPVDDVGAGVLMMVYRTEPGTPLLSEYQTVTASLDAFAGQTVRLRFAAVQNIFFLTVGVDNVQVNPRDAPPVIPVDIDAVFSGPPNREPNQISLDDPSVFVQILDVERYLPRSASPDDVRIGDDWGTGTPAEDFVILDINNDGSRDIQLRFSTQALIDAGHLGPETTQITVWGQDRRDGQIYRGEAEVEIIEDEPPPVGGTITGRVVNRQTGQPVEDASVNVVGTPFGTSTGPDGRFTISGVPAGTYDLEVWRPDFVGRAVEDVTVTVGETTDVGDIAIAELQVGWNTTATAFRGQNGQRFTYYCPPDGSYFTVWGTDIYTDDSAVCVAAVHVGLITYASGGHVTFEIRSGQDSYVGSLRNGVQTFNWGSWPGSFIFPYANP